MKSLIVSPLFPPRMVGGAEFSAWNLACRLRDRGHQVTVLTAADTPEEEERGVPWEGIAMWRMYLPYCYPLARYSGIARWAKPIWHLQDHLDPRNRSVMSTVLDAVRPDIVNIQGLQGMGYNTLSLLAKRRIPVLFTVHDVALACIRAQMFRDGHDCVKQCGICKLSSVYKAWQLRDFQSNFRDIGFCAPSLATLEKLKSVFPLQGHPLRVLLNPNQYPTPTTARTAADHVRLLFVGQLSQHKGISFLLQAMEPLAERFRFTMTVVGGGAEESGLRARYASAGWCRFTGRVSEQEVSNAMTNSDVLCVPSLWTENSPGVVIHALLQGLPVIGSNKGGIPELIDDGITGKLVEAGNAEAWRNAIQGVLESPGLMEEWRKGTPATASRFDPEQLAKEYEDFMELLVERAQRARG